jgi:hypothetical protein
MTTSAHASTQSTPTGEDFESAFTVGLPPEALQQIPAGMESGTNSTISQPNFSAGVSRNASSGGGEFGADINNLVNSDNSGSALGVSYVAAPNMGAKRTRNSSLASAKAIDEEDEPSKASHCVCIAGYDDEAETIGSENWEES